jgi:hypothetical protein
MQRRQKDKYEKYALHVPLVICEYYRRQGIIIDKNELTEKIITMN